MSAVFLSADELLKGGPAGLTHAVERALWYLEFNDVRVIDGAGDHGADLLAVRGREQWVFQCKWKAGGKVDRSGVDDLERARTRYRADKAVLITNTDLNAAAEARRVVLNGVGVPISLWHGATLGSIGDQMPETVPAKYALRPYQAKAADAVVRDLGANGTALLVLATGLGKTVVGGEIISRHLKVNPAARILVVAHMKELVAQLEKAMWRHIPKSVPTRLLTGESRPESLDGVVVGTVESVLGAVRVGYRPDLIMIDETHHVAETGRFAELLDLCGNAEQFGVTATPWRGDKFDITSRFRYPSFKMGIAEGMADGYLSAVDYRLYVDNVDWNAVRDASVHGQSIKDLNKSLFLPQRDEEIIEHFREAWRTTANPRAIVFCQTIEHAEHMAQLFATSDSAWSNASFLHSGLPRQRRQILLNEFRLGRVPVITCVDVFNEGVDVPDVNLIAFLRVTHSRRIFVQQLGRGLRLSPGKEALRVLDFVTDIRRVAATLELRRSLEAQEAQESEHLRVRMPHASRIQFSDETVGSLMDHWIQDAADLETKADEVRLQFPLTTGIE
ncbi:DEAD/DEAH box helicase family protein [[Kitasatospora] papulosa]|uniref:DEAD/DEAH box helicase family protein n=1 Tax=Streptomyces TaxID=1883 RepID=UPI0004C58911|nr:MULTISPECIES: DEAD/DEAH box helicase family protein [Streptomyces]MCY1652888.1 DEAD/DEAH box helicase family protein [Streptomyces sp. SL203]MCY1679893.1 DEAD/DEAH box helicase family protein [Streptomyces sp. SL294]WSZ49358.1 DEAD/DEAH box helicase family protein [[Kitasatospora] papulosa]